MTMRDQTIQLCDLLMKQPQSLQLQRQHWPVIECDFPVKASTSCSSVHFNRSSPSNAVAIPKIRGDSFISICHAAGSLPLACSSDSASYVQSVCKRKVEVSGSCKVEMSNLLSRK